MFNKNNKLSLLYLNAATLFGLALVAMGASPCGTPVQQNGCAVDLDCNPGGGNALRCDVGSATCLCNTNDACDDGEYCNEQGSCQARAGCFSNDDCERPTFCDITTGVCLDPRNSSKNCSQDTHCPFGYYCDGQTCVPGCEDSADCALGYGCVINTCVEGACTTRLDCDFGERCQSNHCAPGMDSVTCTDCTGFSGQLSCGSDGNHECLVNVGYDPNNSRTNPENYCVPKCNSDEDCPMGFDCNDIFAVIGTCSRGETCSNGETCRVGSEATTGYCPCTSDGDCQMMGLSNGCNEDGLCLSGRSCGLFNSLQCWDVGVTNP